MKKSVIFSIICTIFLISCGPSGENKIEPEPTKQPTIKPQPHRPNPQINLPHDPVSDSTVPSSLPTRLPSNDSAQPPLSLPATTNAQFQNVELFGNPGCGLCQISEQLLQQKGIAYTFTNIHTENQAKGQEIRTKYNPTRYPYVFINGNFIGGREELEKLLKDVPNSPTTAPSTPPAPQTLPAIDMKSAKRELFVNPTCGFCRAAEQLLREKGIAFTATDISNTTGNQEKRTQVINAYGAQTYPYVVINGQYIGGYMQLQALIK